MKFYIAGKITGREKDAEFDFANAEAYIDSTGHSYVNPFKLDHSQHDKSWEAYMKVCIKALIECDGIYLLKNWRCSKGACLEHRIACDLELKIHFAEKGRIANK